MIRFIRHHSASIAALDLAIIAIGGIASAYMKAEIEREEREVLRTSGRAPAAALNVTEFDWGEISRTQIAQQDFLISNRGNADLTISTIATSCGCTTAQLRLDGNSAELPAILPPNRQGVIHVEFDPDAHDARGDTERAVRIETNDPDQPFLVINLHAYVR